MFGIVFADKESEPVSMSSFLFSSVCSSNTVDSYLSTDGLSPPYIDESPPRLLNLPDGEGESWSLLIFDIAFLFSREHGVPS